ncbi:uncharacterized protein EV422DRAFT_282619 [Fimicolochytrium jonesii]|uniref:uncharacterized protein n=1 Tax=Fimicolochytrium jonesii TaxID=1396493 RepID=UPI0022FDF7AD|nr:uncharacterized protein EV422DRAFT_282619 [Fimicolochytrium jonesii]KAI8816652.1 hypothetical protein EV422DRAFT_282619 [Fimicolochytrium jonesii]
MHAILSVVGVALAAFPLVVAAPSAPAAKREVEWERRSFRLGPQHTNCCIDAGPTWYPPLFCDCNGTDNQFFGTPGAGNEGLISSLRSDQCLEADSRSAGKMLRFQDCDSTTSSWKFGGGGNTKIRLMGATGGTELCVSSGGTDKPLILADCGGASVWNM